MYTTGSVHRPGTASIARTNPTFVLHPQQVAVGNRREVFTDNHTGGVAALTLSTSRAIPRSKLPGPCRIERCHTAYCTFRQALEAGPDLARDLTKGGQSFQSIHLVIMVTVYPAPGDKGSQHCDSAGRAVGHRRPQALPRITARETANGTTGAEAHTTVQRLAPALVATAEEIMHQVDAGRMEGPKRGGMQQLRNSAASAVTPPGCQSPANARRPAPGWR